MKILPIATNLTVELKFSFSFMLYVAPVNLRSEVVTCQKNDAIGV